jgi:hypothetical protein
MDMEHIYKCPTVDEVKKIFGESLQEKKLEKKQSDVEDFIKLLDDAKSATRKHSVQFG